MEKNIHNFIDNLLYSHCVADNCFTGQVGGVGVNAYIYLILLLSICGVYLFKHPRAVFAVKVTSGIVLVLALILQLSGRLIYFNKEYPYYTSQNINQRYLPYLRPLYRFAEDCRHRLPGKHQGTFLTGMDMSQEVPGKFIYEVLSYYLYPIDIRDVREEDKDCLVVFAKDNPSKNVPKGYRIILKEKNNLLAIKQKGSK